LEEITSGSTVTVARSEGGAVDLEHSIYYRVQSPADGEPAPLPVTYELHIAPTL
jgi:hypothetical protein